MIFRINGVKRAQIKKKTKLKMLHKKRIKMIKIGLPILMKNILLKNRLKKKTFKKMIKRKMLKKLSNLFQKCKTIIILLQQTKQKILQNSTKMIKQKKNKKIRLLIKLMETTLI